MASTAKTSRSWTGEPHEADHEFGLLASDESYVDPYDSWETPPAAPASHQAVHGGATPTAVRDPRPGPADTAHTDTGPDEHLDLDDGLGWGDDGGETGLSGPAVAAWGVLATLAVLTLDFTLTGGVTYFFDLCFVVICLVVGMATGCRDLFTAGVLPPLAYAAAVVVAAAVSPEAFVIGGDRFDRVVLTGLVMHVGALAFGYATTLLVVAGRAMSRRLGAA